MSINYAQGLSKYENKGVCGSPEIQENEFEINKKIDILKDYIQNSKKIVILCGAGISTSCGIPDFRGPNGIWTLEKKNISIENNLDISFEKTLPSFTHLALSKFVEINLIQLIINQNVDGLFLKCGLTRKHLSEMHGNFFLSECNVCLRRFLKKKPSQTMGLKISTEKCPKTGRPCKGFLRDTILDWEDELPIYELNRAKKFCRTAELVLCLCTSLQINPVATIPFLCNKRKKNKGKVVLINLQETVCDKKCDLVIHGNIDNVMNKLCIKLEIKVNKYDEKKDFILNKDEKTIWE